MKPGYNVVLIHPGKDDIQGGPDPDWFEHLVSNLDLVLKKYTGARLQSITPDSEHAGDVLRNAGVLIPVMHGSYPVEGKYIRLLEQFNEERSDNSLHLIRLDASPEKETHLPALLADAASVEMFESSGGRILLIGEESGTYWSRLLDLAAEVKASEDTGSGPPTRENTVYLAQAPADVNLYRDAMKRELVEHGYTVVPVSDLLIHQAELRSHVQNLVDRSLLAIHLLGNAYGEPIKDNGLSIAELQVQYISHYLEAIESDPARINKELSRLIWIDPEFNPVDSKQEAFINGLKRNIENLHRTEIIQTPLELFKTLVINRIKNTNIPSSRTGPDDMTDAFFYVIHSPDDQKEAGELSRGLQNEGLKTGMLNYAGDQRSLLNDHKRFLKDCAGAIVYYGRTNRPWLRSKVMDLLKAPGLGRVTALKSRQVLAAQTDLLEDYSPPEGISVIRETDLSRALAQIVKNLKQ